MRQKIRFDKIKRDGKVLVLESSEVDPGVVLGLHEEEYDLKEIVAASKEGYEAFSEILRRRTFFPASDLCMKLYNNTAAFFADDSMDNVVIEYDDAEAFPKSKEFRLVEEDVEIEKILEEDGDTAEDEIKEIDSEDDTPKFTPEDTSEHEN